MLAMTTDGVLGRQQLQIDSHCEGGTTEAISFIQN